MFDMFEMTNQMEGHLKAEAQRVLDIEAQAILSLKSRMGDAFLKAVHLILNCRGKVIVTGMGKSGLIGRKIASTLSSTGTSSVYLHPAESSHGDLGILAKSDLVIAISYSGETRELLPILSFCSRKDIPVIGMTGGKTSSLSSAATTCLDISVDKEACPLGLAPTSSTTATLALGDALAIALLVARGFKPEDFAEYHPGGRIGSRLLTRVEDLMHTGEALPLVGPQTLMKEVISVMTRKEVRGIAGVVDESESIVGTITDGDIRRRLDKSENPLVEVAKDFMSGAPKTIDRTELAEKALFMMEQFDIRVLFVVEKQSANPRRPVGILHIQDLLKAKVR
jgi:arabinose-5-phosphate isomerase